MSVEIFTKAEFEEKALPKLKVDPTKPAWRPLGLIKGEWAYLVPLPNQTAIQVRSSVKRDGKSAESGGDSIRCWIIDETTGGALGGKISKYTTRKPGWAERTLKVIRELAKMAIKVRTCPKCQKERLGIFKVKKDGPNHGRPFASCKGEGCGYFEWID